MVSNSLKNVMFNLETYTYNVQILEYITLDEITSRPKVFNALASGRIDFTPNGCYKF